MLLAVVPDPSAVAKSRCRTRRRSRRGSSSLVAVSHPRARCHVQLLAARADLRAASRLDPRSALFETWTSGFTGIADLP